MTGPLCSDSGPKCFRQTETATNYLSVVCYSASSKLSTARVCYNANEIEFYSQNMFPL